MDQPFLKLLLVEDSSEDAELLLRELKEGGYDPVSERVDDLESMKRALTQKKWDLIIIDHTMPNFNSEAATSLLNELGSETPFILVSGTIGEDAGVEAMKAGAKDYILKGNFKRLIPVVDRTLRDAVERDRLKARIEKIAADLKARTKQQEIVAVIGQLALSGMHPALLMNDIVYLVAQTLRADLALFLELLPDDRTLLLRAGFGCREGAVGKFSLTAEEALEHGFPSLYEEPIVFADLPTEKRFQPLSFLVDHGVVSGLSVSIWGQDRAYGALGIYTKTTRLFDQEDVNFLQAIANILATAMDRASLEKHLLKQSG